MWASPEKIHHTIICLAEETFEVDRISKFEKLHLKLTVHN